MRRLLLFQIFPIVMGWIAENRQVTVGVSSSSSASHSANRKNRAVAPGSIFCETFAYYSAVEGSNADPHGRASAVAYPILSQMLRRMRGQYQKQEEEQEIEEEEEEDAVQLAVDVTRTFFKESIHETMLPLQLSLRAHAPFCDMHQSLAQQALAVIGGYRQAFVVLPGATQPFLVDTLQDLQIKLNTNIAMSHADITRNITTMPWAQPLDREIYYDSKQRQDSNRFAAILYGNIESPLFVSFFNLLEQQATFPFLVRFMLPSNQTNAHFLQGYGVRLDIRNIEYTAFDDSNTIIHRHQNNSSSNQNKTHIPLPIIQLQQYLLQQVSSNTNTTVTDARSFQLHAQTIPPKTLWKDLALQATTVVLNSHHIMTTNATHDPLWTLQELTQNLPSYASILSQIQVPESIRQVARHISSFLNPNHPSSSSSYSSLTAMLMAKHQEEAIFQFYIHGKLISLFESPTYNIFQILQFILEEDFALSNMIQTLKPCLSTYLNTTSQLQVSQKLSAWTAMSEDDFHATLLDTNSRDPKHDTEDNYHHEMNPSVTSIDKPLRIDVGHGYRGAVLYLNDVEKDARYKSWPRQVTQMLMAMQFQSAPRIRRNMLTVLLVIDPTETNPDSVQSMATTIHILLNLVQSNFPIRIGLLLVHNEDVEQCKKQLLDSSLENEDGPCTVPEPWTSTSGTTDNASLVHSAFLMVQHAIRVYDGFFALQYVGKMLEDLSATVEDEGRITLDHMIDFHVSIMSMIDVVPEVARAEITHVLETADSHDSQDNYAKAITFAARKSVKSGSAFVNGRPVMLSNPREIQTVVMDELSYIAELIQAGQITDSKPRSIYGYFLNSDRVYPKMHPLLVDRNKRDYDTIQHNYNHHSILTSWGDGTKKMKELDALYLLDIVMDINSEHGLDFALSGLNATQRLREKFQTEIKYQQMGIAVRFRPSDSSIVKDSAVHRVLCSAGQLDVDEFHTFLLLWKNALKSGIAIDSSKEAADIIAKVKNDDSCMFFSSTTAKVTDHSNYISLNGRYYVPQPDELIQVDDIDILLDLEKTRTRVVTQLIQAHVIGDHEAFEVVSRITAYFGKHFSSDKVQRKNVAAMLKHLRSIPSIESFIFSWNHQIHKVQIVCILDPLTEAAQRASSLLSIIRDDLRLPLTVVIAPRVEIHESSIPISSYYRFVAYPESFLSLSPPVASFQYLPTNHVLTLRLDVPESWDVQQISSVQDTDNLRCDLQGCGDSSSEHDSSSSYQPLMTYVEYGLKSLLFFGQCFDISVRSPPNGLQLTLSKMVLDKNTTAHHSKYTSPSLQERVVVLPDGSVSPDTVLFNTLSSSNLFEHHSDTLVMKTLGYWQLRANPGVWKLEIASNSKGASMFDMIDGSFDQSGVVVVKSHWTESNPSSDKILVKKDYLSKYEPLLVRRKEGFEDAELLSSTDHVIDDKADDDTVHVFSLATGHLYERFLKIMMLSVTKRTSTRVKFWLFENFLSPGFKVSVAYMADRIGCQVEFVTYKWPEWLRSQSEKQRIIWGYKILFLDVLFPLNLKKVIYVDADQVVRADLKELWDLDLEGAPYGYTPFCTSRESTLGYQFWRSGFWKDHLRGNPYHISALYVVDLERFRRELVGDHLRSVYQQLSADPNSLSNLDQDLPNYVQDVIKIRSLPQEWLWCESWCSDETKATAKTIDLCNNPEHKEPKVSMAKRIISGDLFNESWIELDNEVHAYEKEYLN